MAYCSRTPARLRGLLVGIRYWKPYIQKKSYCDIEERPIKYSTTKASKMTTHDTFYGKPDTVAFKSEPYILLGSILVLLIYGVFLREENKLDWILDGNYNYPEDDEVKLLNMLLRAKLSGLNTEELEKRLADVRAANKIK